MSKMRIVNTLNTTFFRLAQNIYKTLQSMKVCQLFQVAKYFILFYVFYVLSDSAELSAEIQGCYIERCWDD